MVMSVKQALGLVEVKGLSTAIEVADTMAKAANITIHEWERAKGNGLMTVKVLGDVGAVRAAVEAGSALAKRYGTLVSTDIIARPHEGVETLFIRKKTVSLEDNSSNQETVEEKQAVEQQLAKDVICQDETASVELPSEPQEQEKTSQKNMVTTKSKPSVHSKGHVKRVKK